MRYYLTKSNPNTFRLLDFLAICPDTSRWTIVKDAKPRDILYIGLSGEQSGIYAKATVISKPEWGGEDPDFWVNPEEAAKPRWRADIKFRENLLQRKCPLLERTLVSVPQLHRIAKWLHVQGSSCRVKEEEAAAINSLIERN